jgi:hypothetical protein
MRKKCSIEVNGTNENKPVLINQINENEEDEIDAIKKNRFRGENYNPNYQTNRNNNSNLNKCSF